MAESPVVPRDAGTLRISARLLRPVLKGETRQSALGMFFLLAVTAATLLQPWPLKLVVDSVLGNHRAPAFLITAADVISANIPWLDSPRLGLLLILCLGVLLIQLLIGAFNVLSTYMLVAVGLRLVFRLRCALFDHIQRLSLTFHDANPVGDSLYRVTWDTYSAQSLFNAGIVPAVTAVITLIGITAVMLSIDWMVTVVALAVGVPLIVLIRRLDRPMTDHSLRVHERESDVSARVQETLSSIRAVQAFGREDVESSRFRHNANSSLHANLRLTLLQAGSQALVGLLLAAGTAAVVWVGAKRALDGSLTIGDLVLVVSYVAMLYKPLETLAYTAATIQGATAGARRVFAVLDAKPAISDDAHAIPLPHRVWGRIGLDHVTFTYPAGATALRDVSLDIAPGSTVAFVGASGAGKTTLMNLLLRFYDPTCGTITLDGHDLREVKVDDLRRSIAVVLQDPVLFAASIAENIAYARPDATPAQIEAAAVAAGADEFIRGFAHGYETQIGERGVSLSGGQRQRLSIARAFLKDAPILILDEPTSALDAESEAYLLESLQRLKRGRTTLIVAHRLSTIQHADKIVVLREGQVVEQGGHRELLGRDGAFRRLYDVQRGFLPARQHDNASRTAMMAVVE